MSGGDSSYNWMAPSLQSQDISFSIGSLDSPSQESTQSSLLFSTSKMKPPRRPLRPVGKGFGTTILKPDDLSSSQDPKEEQRREILKLKRRFIRDRKTTSEYYAKSQARKNIAREVRCDSVMLVAFLNEHIFIASRPIKANSSLSIVLYSCILYLCFVTMTHAGS